MSLVLVLRPEIALATHHQNGDQAATNNRATVFVRAVVQPICRHRRNMKRAADATCQGGHRPKAGRRTTARLTLRAVPSVANVAAYFTISRVGKNASRQGSRLHGPAAPIRLMALPSRRCYLRTAGIDGLGDPSYQNRDCLRGGMRTAPPSRAAGLLPRLVAADDCRIGSAPFS
jgi:hypothetical protein